MAEVRIFPEIQKSLQDLGIPWALPIVLPDGEMEFHKYRGPERLRKNSLGFFSPDIEEDSVVRSDQLCLIIVPGVGFDESCGRIGRGKGHYDRYLQHCPSVQRWAVAFDVQVVKSLELESWDQRMDWVITESREIGPGRLTK